MWFRDYEDYENDSYAKKHRVTTGEGFQGAEMRERLGWGESYQEHWEVTKPQSPGKLAMLLAWMFGMDLKGEKEKVGKDG